MMRISMDKRFKIGTIFNICLVIFFGLFAIYHISSINETIRLDLDSDIKLFLSTEKGTKDLQSLILKYSNLEVSEEALSSPDFSIQCKTLRNEFMNMRDRLADLLGSDSHLLEEISQKTKFSLVEKSGIDTANALKTQLTTLLQKLNNEILFLRNRNLNFLTIRREGIAKISKSFQGRIVLVTILTSIAAFIVLFFLAHQIKLPTRKIIEIIRKIKDGQYAVPVRQHTGNEIDQIVSGLSNMAENIKIRDQLKMDKIQLEKKRFAALANFLDVPLILINDEKKAAFANDELMTLFKLSWDDLYEIELAKLPLPIELKEKLGSMINEKKWVENEPFDVIGQNYAFELHLSLIPVKTPESNAASVIIILGKIPCRKRAVSGIKTIAHDLRPGVKQPRPEV